MNKKLVIFDMDGTLIDSSHGIVSTYQYTLNRQLGVDVDEQEILTYIGSSPKRIFIDKYHMTETQALNALHIYRTRYADKGFSEASVYPEIVDMLSSLKTQGYIVAVATLKLEAFALKMLNINHIEQYFNIVRGVDNNDMLTKTMLIDDIKGKYPNISNENIYMVGDAINDREAAVNNGINFIAVTYGFGYKPGDKIDAVGIADTPNDIIKYI